MNSRIKAKLVQLLHRTLIALISGEDEQYRDYWQWRWLDWDNIPWPWQAGAGDAALYRRVLETHGERGCRVLILGATPALRIIAAEVGAEVVCADFSISMLSRMGRYVEKKIPGALRQEVWFCGDWFKIPFPENYFDIVFGDNVLLFVSPAAHHDFLERVSRAMKPSGFFMTRVRIVDETLWNVPPEHVFEKFRKCFPVIDRPDIAIPYLSLLLLNWSWDEKTGRTSRGKIAAVAAAYRNSLPHGELRRFLDAFLRRSGIGIDFYFAKEKGLEEALGRHFKIVEKSYAAASSSPMADFVSFYPLYLLRKNGQ